MSKMSCQGALLISLICICGLLSNVNAREPSEPHRSIGFYSHSRLLNNQFAHLLKASAKRVTARVEEAEAATASARKAAAAREARASSRKATPRVAVCLTGTRFDMMQRYNLFESFDAMIVRALGGPDAVDIYINTDSSETGSSAIEELNKRFTVRSVRALGETTLQNLSSTTCPEGTLRSTGSGDRVPCHPAVSRDCSSMQYLRLEACFDEIREHERAKDFQYDWVARVRPDTFYKSPITETELLLTKDKLVIAPCASMTWGVCDFNTVVSRKSAFDYFHGIAERVRTCINITAWESFAPDPKFFYPENLAAFHLRSLGYHFGSPESVHQSRHPSMEELPYGYVYGGTTAPALVRSCGCPPNETRATLPPATLCGEDIARTCV